jgi:hypothetical protein
MLKKGLTAVLALTVAAVAASSADAFAPIKTQYPLNVTVVVNDLCAFPVTIAQSDAITEIDFLDKTGGLTRVVVHVKEQDTFSANGITLIGSPYTATENVTFDSSGNIVRLFAEGVLEDVPLPNGGVFFSAGRVNVLAHPNETLAIVPDVGVSGDVGALCAALTP